MQNLQGVQTYAVSCPTYYTTESHKFMKSCLFTVLLLFLSVFNMNSFRILSKKVRTNNVAVRGMAAGSPKFVNVLENRAANPESSVSCKIMSGHHTLMSDVTKTSGGADSGPSPKELLMSALGSCTAMTIRLYYEHSKAKASSSWSTSTLKEINVKVEESGDHPHVPSKLSIHIGLVGDLTSEQRERLLAVSKNCPVKKIINNNTEIDSVLV